MKPLSDEILTLSTTATLLYLTLSSFLTLSGFIDVGAFRGADSNTIKSRQSKLRYALAIETAVGLVAGIVYYMFLSKSADSAWVLNRRYLDWYLTTPLLLLSFALYCGAAVDDKITPPMELSTLLKRDYVYAFVLTLAMLILGFLHEKTRNQARNLFLVLGFVAFAFVFWFMREIKNRAKKEIVNSGAGKGTDVADATYELDVLFWIFLGVWFLYGVVAAIPQKHPGVRHVSYNVLDGISKATFGVFLWWKTISLKTP